jgi:hypothetical protein
LGSSTCATDLKTSGSRCSTHISFGAVNPGMAMLPVILRLLVSQRSSSAHCAEARPSFHRIAGRSTRCPASSKVAPCIWPDSPRPRTSA